VSFSAASVTSVGVVGTPDGPAVAFELSNGIVVAFNSSAAARYFADLLAKASDAADTLRETGALPVEGRA